MFRRIVPALVALAAVMPAARVEADIVYFVSKSDGGLYTFNTASGSSGPISPLSGAGPGRFTNASALAMGPDGNLYVGDEDATGIGRIQRYTMAGGGVSTVVSLSGTNPLFASGTVAPAAIAFTPSGSMLVGRNPEKRSADYPPGQVLEVVGWNTGSPTVQNYTSGTALNFQAGLAVAPDGTVYASNTTYGPINLEGNVVKFDDSGAYQSVVASGAGTDRFGPAGLALSGNSLYIASIFISLSPFEYYGDIYKTDLTDPNLATNTSSFASVIGDVMGPLALLSDGGLLAGSVLGPEGRIYQFSSNGALVTTFNQGASYGQIGGIVAVPEPGAIVLAFVGVACAGLGRLRRRRRE